MPPNEKSRSPVPEIKQIISRIERLELSQLKGGTKKAEDKISNQIGPFSTLMAQRSRKKFREPKTPGKSYFWSDL